MAEMILANIPLVVFRLLFTSFYDTSQSVMKINALHYLSSVYFVIQPLHVSGIFVAHHQEVYCTYTTIGTCCAFQLTVCWPAAQQTVNWKAQHVPIVVYIQYTS